MSKTTLVLALSLAACLTACGKEEAPAPATEAAPAAPATQAAAPAAPAAEASTVAANHEDKAGHDDNELGKSVYGKVCSLCHSVGAAGAPKFGDKTDWGPRIAQGKDMLYKHALEGFTGKKGTMPSRGGNPKLTDDEVKAGVNYMVSQAQ